MYFSWLSGAYVRLGFFPESIHFGPIDETQSWEAPVGYASDTARRIGKGSRYLA